MTEQYDVMQYCEALSIVQYGNCAYAYARLLVNFAKEEISSLNELATAKAYICCILGEDKCLIANHPDLENCIRRAFVSSPRFNPQVWSNTN